MVSLFKLKKRNSVSSTKDSKYAVHFYSINSIYEKKNTAAGHNDN